jgi:hypothetical protein
MLSLMADWQGMGCIDNGWREHQRRHMEMGSMWLL